MIRKQRGRCQEATGIGIRRRAPRRTLQRAARCEAATNLIVARRAVGRSQHRCLIVNLARFKRRVGAQAPRRAVPLRSARYPGARGCPWDREPRSDLRCRQGRKHRCVWPTLVPPWPRCGAKCPREVSVLSRATNAARKAWRSSQEIAMRLADRMLISSDPIPAVLATHAPLHSASRPLSHGLHSACDSYLLPGGAGRSCCCRENSMAVRTASWSVTRPPAVSQKKVRRLGGTRGTRALPGSSSWYSASVMRACTAMASWIFWARVVGRIPLLNCRW